jgi:O-succinylbenzoic acid--CoA ligase
MNSKNSLDNSILDSANAFFEAWESGQSEFPLHTSGSTGNPTIMYRSRAALTCSAEATAQALHITEKDHIFCCLPLDKTGGFMQLVRSKVWNVPITIVPPTLNPLLEYEGNASIISLTPQQFHHVISAVESRQNLNTFRIVLIGGGALSEQSIADIHSLDPEFYETYGMTETCSHIALRNVKKETHFQLLPGIEIDCAEDETLRIKGCVTDNVWIQTHDRVEMSNAGLRFLGRIDNIINTGGIKIQAEWLENEIINQFNFPANSIAISNISDKVLGEKIVLVLDENKIQHNATLNFDFLPKSHFKPRHILWIQGMPITETNKLKRTEIKNWVQLQLVNIAE